MLEKKNLMSGLNYLKYLQKKNWSKKFEFINLIKLQNRAAVISIDYPAALPVIVSYPALCGTVLAARYCKHWDKLFSCL